MYRGAMADSDAVRSLPPLPETADELRGVAKSLGAGEKDLYLGERASERCCGKPVSTVTAWSNSRRMD